jgi:hypothetical protein
MRGFTHTKRSNADPDARLGRPRSSKKKKTPRKTAEDTLNQMWADDYWPLVNNMFEEDPELTGIITRHLHESRSSYNPQAAAETLQQYFQRHKWSIANVVMLMQTIGHQQRGVDTWKLCKSFAAMKQCMRRRQWAQEVKQGSLLEYKATKRKLKLFMTLKPPLPYTRSTLISRHVSDQLMLFRECKKKRQHRSVERAGEDGEKERVESKVILNMIDYPINAEQYPVTAEEEAEIRLNGIWSEPGECILEHLNWSKTQDTIHDLFDEHTDIMLKQYGNNPSWEDFMYLLQRPNFNPGAKTDSTVLPPIPDCDTNNYNGMQKYVNNVYQTYPDSICNFAHMDGQGIYTCTALGERRQERLANTVFIPAGMHGGIHVLYYSGQALYWTCILEACNAALGFEKIESKPTNLEGNKADNHRCFQHAVALACRFHLWRKYGPMRSRRLSQAVIMNAGDETAFQFVLQVGGAGLEWLKAARGNRCSMLDRLWEWGFFMGYSNHKTIYNYVSVIRARARYCLHPALRQVVALEQTISSTGRVGCNYHVDDDIEYLNNEIQRFNSKADSFEVAMVYAENYEGLAHVDQKYSELLGTDGATPMEARAGMKATVQALVNWMAEKMELHKDQPDYNYFTSTQATSGDKRKMAPWDHIHNCAMGTSYPIGFPKSHKHYEEYVRNVLRKKGW